MDIIQNQQIFKVTANLLTSKLVSFQMGIFTNLQALELFSSLTNFFQKSIFFILIYIADTVIEMSNFDNSNIDQMSSNFAQR